MKSREERFALVQDALSHFGDLKIQHVRPTLCAPYDDDLSVYGFTRVEWAPYMWIGDEALSKEHPLFRENKVFAIGLASVLSVLQLKLKAGDKVLDMCAAPGIKSLYLQLLHDKKLNLYVNDISQARLLRLRMLFESFSIQMPHFTHQPGQTLTSVYDHAYFDAVIIDAPCSGEGNIFKGDEQALASWSQAKVKRLAGLQRKLVVTAQRLVKEDGTLLYATCTLNQHENESALKKAHQTVDTVYVESVTNRELHKGEALRILPSNESIGFFVAKL